MQKMETVETRITSLEKRMDKHGTELDTLESRLHLVEGNQRVFQLQLEALKKIENELKEMNKGLVKVNDTVVESKHKLEMVAINQVEDREEIRTLKKQRDIDHNIKPQENVEKLKWQIITPVITALVAFLLSYFGFK